ncbi:uncharacterized protein LTR77_011193 [Saxophila tyrrhenica]|uniref:Rad4-domain-containing protein n=1 Tax=Saxophila tyrrhenica TaxID=1690608 RepID=A0AAV9NVV0_9PEZI|nr:hypothetical protein LTR77_011193 [Saxophila tyrrhenica]
MAPNRGKGKARAVDGPARALTNGQRTTRSSRKSKAGNDDVYGDMLAEAAVVDPLAEELSDRPLKRRRVAAKSKPDAGSPGKHERQLNTPPRPLPLNMQTVEDSSASDDEDESDFGFEDVDLDQPAASSPAAADQHDDGIADVSVAVDSVPKRQVRLKRKPASVAEKAYRLQVHKAHVLCLLGHCMYINSWCNNLSVQRHLRPLLPKNVISFLNPKAADSQFRQTEAFMDGLRQASDIFRGTFQITASGMRSAQWETEPDDIKAGPVDRSDFISAARDLEGSQDTGNQLFCALLRSVGVEARLVCSLQPLPFGNPTNKSSTPQKVNKPVVYATASGMRSSAPNSDTDDHAMQSSSTVGKVPSARRRLGQPSFAPDPAPPVASSKPKTSVRRLNFPVFWIEAFNPAHQKWIPVDPIVSSTVAKPSKLEPPSSYHLTQLSYAIAFEQDCVVRDVTRRYARAFNAKTRRTRVESTTNGAAWFKKVLRFFRRRGEALDRDQVEDAELSQREAKEGLPGNVVDFKDHPYYALERHMRRHEVIHPRREVGKVNAGTAAKPRMEAVYRRTDVCICRSADKWFRLGREIKEGEQPLKRIPAPRSRRLQRSPSAAMDGDDGGEEEREMTPLYAHFQTDLYVPQPVRNGKVPRNAFGNLDIYVPSMVPAGGVHVRHPLARDAAKVLGVDWVDAVTGFKFEGRRGTPVTDGVVIAEENGDSVRTIIEGLLDERVEEEAMARSKVALGLWRKFLVGLRIRERVATYGEAAADVEMEEDHGGNNDDLDYEGGGFVQSDAADNETLPTAGRFSLMELASGTASRKKKVDGAAKQSNKRVKDEESEEAADFSDAGSEDGDEDDSRANPSTSASRVTRSRRRIVEDEDSAHETTPERGEALHTAHHHASDEEGGGFLPDDSDNDITGGGFLPSAVTQEGYGGGGFVPTDDGSRLLQDGLDEGGGGFLPDEEAGPEVDDHVGNAAGDFLPVDGGGSGLEKDDHDDHGGGFVPDEDDMATEGNDGHSQNLQPRNEPHQELSRSANTPAEPPGEKQASDQTDIITSATPNRRLDADTTTRAINSSVTIAGTEPAASEADESDRGSMLSHDPEDEDAEPDWLESD